MKKSTINLIYILIVCFCVTSCSTRNYLEEALTQAGENRAELEKALAHYVDDPLKRKATEFLIENMPGHFSYDEMAGLTAYYNEIDSIYAISLLLPRMERLRLYDSISDKYKKNKEAFKRYPDPQVVSADYLIANIERSFHLWQNGEWATHIDFEDFCEYILPYKICDGQTLDAWKTYGERICKGDIGILHHCDTYKNLAIKSCEVVNNELKKKLNPFIDIRNNRIPIRRTGSAMKIIQGVCDDYCFVATSMMRAKGIPVAIDYTPQWPFKNLGHTWNVVLDNFGKNTVFLGCDEPPGIAHKADQRMAKTFRKTFAINRELEEVFRTEGALPEVFDNFCFKDVSNEYMRTYDVEVELNFKPTHKYAYLAVFDNQKWVPVYWGKIKGRKAFFARMGPNAVYLPVCYSDNELVPVGDPFILTHSGEKLKIKPDTTKTNTLNLYRKYYFPPTVYQFFRRIVGSSIQAANKADFSDAVTLHVVKEPGLYTGKVSLPDYTPLYRYWRYLSSGSGYCNLAELYFFEKGNKEPLYGKIIGTNGSFQDNGRVKENLFDGDPLTQFHAPTASEGWAGMDYGRPVNIDRILYIPRNDGNSIVYGNEYELVYWNNGDWVSLGKQIAGDNNYLEYKECPESALFLLHNLTEGTEERIFMYENDTQVWW